VLQQQHAVFKQLLLIVLLLHCHAMLLLWWVPAACQRPRLLRRCR
jgi:hypothetical protein